MIIVIARRLIRALGLIEKLRMAKINEILRKSMGLDEKPARDIRPFRRKMFLGVLAWMVFALIGGLLFEHTPVMKLVGIILLVGWCVIVFFIIKNMISFMSGRR